MIPPLIDHKELSSLALQFGEPLYWARTMDIGAMMFERARHDLKEKRGEVVLAIPRPQNRVLLQTKSFYPQGVFRLPSGGIEIGEPVERAANREIHEETGLSIRLTRFLGLIEYEFHHGPTRLNWASYVFLTEETDAPPAPVDQAEHISDFREIEWRELERVATALDQLPLDWKDWGRFRALAHVLVLETMGLRH